MAGISEELRLDIASFLASLQTAVTKAQVAVAQINAAASGGAGGFNKTGEAASKAGGNMTQAAGRASQFAAAVRKTAAAAAGIAAITAAAILLRGRFPQIAAAAVAAFARIRAGAATAARSAGPVSMALVKIATRAATVAAAVQTMAAAYRFLFGNAAKANAEMAKTKTPSGGGGGGKGSFLGALVGGAAGGGIGAAIGNSIVSGIRGASAQIKAALVTPLAAAADEETLKVSLGVLIGDEGKTDRILEEMQQKAASTSFEFPGLAGAAQKLLNYGVAVDSVMPTLDMLGDISGGNAEKLDALANVFGQMSSTGRLMGQDLLQMINAGFNPLQEISKRTGRDIASLKKDMEMGDIDASIVIQAFRDATSEGGRFYGMMAKQSQTIHGKMSTLKDVIMMNWKAFGAPINDALKPLLDIAIEKVASLRDRAAEIGAAAATGLRQIVAAIGMIASMPMAEIGKVLGAALRGAAVGMVNFLYRGLVAAFGAGGQILSEYGRAAVALIGIVNKADFWKGMASALMGLAKTFAAAFLEGVSHVIKGMKEGMGAAGRKVFGNADERLSSQADSLRASAVESAKDGGFNLAPYLRDAMAGVAGSLSRIAGEFSRVFSETGNVLNLPAESAALLGDFAAKIKQVMADAKNATSKAAGAGGGGAGGEGGTGQAKQSLPAIAGRLAGAVHTITGKSANEVLQEKGNALLQQIADNTSKNTKPQPKVVSPVARAVGVFS